MAAIITDIEGTTGSIAFVKEVLFPYARVRIADFLRDHAARADVAVLIRDAARDAGMAALDPDEAAAVFLAWMDADLKVTTLKTLQGLIWEAGYRDGTLRGHVYDDAAAALVRWHAAGHRLHVYSSGSVAAQKLLFGYSTHGDLSGLFSGYFDTTVGPKTEAASYTRILGRIGTEAGATLFLSDSPAEIAAAHEAGLHTVWVVRADNPQPRDAAPPCDQRAADFSEIDPDALTA